MLELISGVLETVYQHSKTSYFKDVLQKLRENYTASSNLFGKYTVRYLLLNLREELLERVMPSQFSPQWKCDDLFLSRKCLPFERNPLISDLVGSKTSTTNQAKYLAKITKRKSRKSGQIRKRKSRKPEQIRSRKSRKPEQIRRRKKENQDLEQTRRQEKES